MKSALVAVVLLGTSLFSAPTAQSRQAPTDLEIGDKFVSYQDLLHLPQVSFPSDDFNFPTPAALAGVSLEELKRSFGTDGEMVVAICKDGYRSNYPASYMAAHHPVLVLTVDGKPQSGWPKAERGLELGPYVIANPNFTPSFKVLSHSDEPAIPFQVVKIEFRNEHQVFGAIEPHGDFAPGSPVMDGYRIAQQNCYRCHNMGSEGGQMAGLGWPVIAMMAKSSPDFFAKYVRNPQALNPSSRMAGSPQYDDQTIAALRAYFSTFAPGEQK
jgi:cytochrome c2